MTIKYTNNRHYIKWITRNAVCSFVAVSRSLRTVNMWGAKLQRTSFSCSHLMIQGREVQQCITWEDVTVQNYLEYKLGFFVCPYKYLFLVHFVKIITVLVFSVLEASCSSSSLIKCQNMKSQNGWMLNNQSGRILLLTGLAPWGAGWNRQHTNRRTDHADTRLN